MSQDQLTLVLIIFGAVIVLSILMIVGAVAIRRKRVGAQRFGPGGPDAQLPTDPRERFGPALAAVYARHEWHATRGAHRKMPPEQTYYGYGCVLPLPMLRQSLASDWQVRSADQARERVDDVLESFSYRLSDGAAIDHGELAFDIVRFANLVRWCGSAGLITLEQARDASDFLAETAAAAFDGWHDLGRHYVTGLRAWAGHGTAPFERAVDWLLSDPESPWLSVPWPRP